MDGRVSFFVLWGFLDLGHPEKLEILCQSQSEGSLKVREAEWSNRKAWQEMVTEPCQLGVFV